MKQRLKIVRFYQQLRSKGLKEGEAARQTAERSGCSVSSVRNYFRAWRKEGKRGLMPVIKTREYPPKTPWEVIQIILLFRRLLHWGGDRIAAELASRGIYRISGQGVYNLFKRYRVSTRTYHPVGKGGGIRYKRVKVTKANEVWHLDFAGPFTTSDGRKCWVLLAVDAYSRLLLTLKVVESLEADLVLEHLNELFARYGKPTRIVTDNGPTFASVWENNCHRFSQYLESCGIEHHRIPAYYPEANGKAEGAVKIVKKEAILPFFKAYSDWSIEGFQSLLDRFWEYYNFDRLHGGIDWRTPAQCWLTKGDKPPKQLDNLFFITEPELHFEFC
jgi:putative transposase